jgi:hypothetical protein
MVRLPSLPARRLPVLLLLLLAAAAAPAADPVPGPGGAYLSALGRERIRVKAPGVKPGSLFGNLRFDFDGSAGDAAGAGTLLAYDEAGQVLLSSFPFSWATGRGTTLSLDLEQEGLAAFLADGIESLVGGAAVVTLETVAARGKLRAGGTDLRVGIRAQGTVSLDEGPPRRFRASLRLS